MKCRFCKKELINGEEREFETLGDHVCDPNGIHRPLRATYICSDENCIANTIADGFWDDIGEFYHSNWGAKELESYKNYSGGLSAYESSASSIDTEVYKQDENFTFYKGLKWSLGIEYKYKADDNGRVIKRTPKLSIERKDFNSLKHMIEYIVHFGKTKDHISHIRHQTNLHMLKYCLKRYFDIYDNYNTTRLVLADYLVDSENDMIAYTSKRLKQYKNDLVKIVNSSSEYKKWGNRSKPSDIIHGVWDWYRPLSNKIITNHYKEHIGDRK